MMTPDQIGRLRECLLSHCPTLTNLSPKHSQSIYTENGKAVSLDCALNQCIDDFKRTAIFIDAAKQAISKHGKRVLCIGSGPLGILLLPTLLGNSGLEVTFVEINEIALNALESLCEKLALSKRHTLRFICADACEEPLAEHGSFDVLISETMNRFLEHEPYVSLIQKNIHNLRKGGILIPEQVTLKVNDHVVFEVNQAWARQPTFTPISINTKDTQELVCTTHVSVIEGLKLKPDESLITKTITKPVTGNQATLRYITGRHPRMGIEWE